MLKDPEIQEETFSRRLITVYVEICKFRTITKFNIETFEAANNYTNFALEYLNKDISKSIKRDLLNGLIVFLYIPKLKEIIIDEHYNGLCDLYTHGLYETNLLTILINLGFFDNKLKTEIIKAIQDENKELLGNFCVVSLSAVKEDKVPIITELHSISQRIDKETDKSMKNIIENLIKNLEKYA